MEPEPQIAETSSAPKPKNKLALPLVLVSILAATGIAFGVYGFFFKKPSTEDTLEVMKSDSNIETISTVTKPEEIDTSKPLESQEVTVTNQYVIRDLNHKLAILHSANTDFATESNKYISTALAYNSIGNLYGSGELPDAHKAAIAISSNIKQYSEWSDQYTRNSESIISEVNEHRAQEAYLMSPAMTQDELRNTGYIPYYEANRAYADTFGGTLPKSDVSAGCTRSYKYINSADGFMNVVNFLGAGGCGGAGFPGFAVRKNSYKAKGDEIFVDVNAITAIVNENNCDVYSGYPDIVKEGEQAQFSSEKLDSYENHSYYCAISDEYLESHDSLFDNAVVYRFVFKKSSSSTYYFDKLEKL